MPTAIPWWATPLLSSVLALVVAWLAISFDRRKTVNQELIKKRVAIYDEVAPQLNDILCFFLLVGNFRSLKPATLIAHKRDLDRKIHVYIPIFSPDLKPRYDEFMDACFLAFGGGAGRPALIRANFERLKGEWDESWREEWSQGFVAPEYATPPPVIQQSYDALMAQFARELGVGRRG